MADPCTSFVCPRCKGSLGREERQLVCATCAARFKLIAGDIPIFLDESEQPQQVPDPGLSFPAAVALAEKMHQTPGTFHDLVDAYYRELHGTQDPALYEYCRTIARKRRIMTSSDEASMIARGLESVGVPLPRVRLALEFGCGWGFSLAALAIQRIVTPELRGARLCGFDLNPAILPLARRLLDELELPNISLAVADATRPLPFPEHGVDMIYSNGVVEHVPQQDQLMGNLSRALSPESVLHFLIPNRYMIHPEPHYGVRWVGFVPRRLQPRYVGYRLGIEPRYVETILSYSPRDLAELMGRHFPDEILVACPCDPTDVPLWQRALNRALGLLGANRYHCIARRGATSAAGVVRGRLHLTTTSRGNRPLGRAALITPRAA